MSYPEEFTGYAAFDKDCVKGNFKPWNYKPKDWEETDVDIKIKYCGICASDIHTATSGWGPAEYPIVVGHEIVGEAVRVGKEVKHVKVGDIVGVGAQCDSCLQCNPCQNDREPYCDEGLVGTYGGKFKKGAAKGQRSQGGYSNYNRSPGHFVIKIPTNLDPAIAAPLLCGGVTVYSPLKRYGAGTTAKKVGVVGIGGLGHFAVILGTALGAEVTAISHSNSKEEDAKKMGASHFIATHDDDAVFEQNKRTLDLIICTTNDSKMPLDGYVQLLKPGGRLVFVGVPEGGIPMVPPTTFIFNNIHVGGSLIGSPAEINEMLALVADKGLKGWIKKYDMKEVNDAVVAFNAGKPRYRFVLVNTENGGEL